MSKSNKYYIGCSGFHYKSWRGPFYPEDMKSGDWLSYYAEKFNTVEINNSFYSLPAETTLQSWDENTPDDFLFTFKGSRYITHTKKLKADDTLKNALDNFFERVLTMQKKIGCILWQLPGNLHRNDEKLSSFIKLLPEEVQHVIEFRHASWMTKEIMQILDENQIGFCSLSSPISELNIIHSSNKIAYFRFHGENKKEWYHYKYSDEELKNWSKEIKKAGSEKVFAYFNNDMEANAPLDAMELNEKLK